jgi:hypothetical protein
MKRLLKISAWVVVALVIIGGIAFVARQQETAAEKYERERESRCVAAFPAASEAEKQDACKHEKDSGRNYLPWWYVLLTWPEGITTWAIIATGFVIAWQSRETRKAAEATQNSVVTAGKSLALQEKTAKSQLRAYFGIPEGKLCIFADGRVEPRLTFKNCGQTPAYAFEIEQCGRFESRGNQYSPPRRNPDIHPHPHIVGGGSSYHFTCDPVHSGRGKDALLNDLASGHVAFKLYGKCTYRDAFKDPHFIDFQLFVGGGAQVQYTTDPDHGSLIMLTDCEGNSAD